MSLIKYSMFKIHKLLNRGVVQIEPTRLCNFNCKHCNHSNNYGEISLDTYLGILDRHKKCEIVKLQGLGEPLLHSCIQELINIPKRRSQKVMVITNGTCEYVENVDFYVFSLETMSNEVFRAIGKKDLDKVLSNIKFAASKQEIIINCVQCMSTSPQDVADVSLFAANIGAKVWITPQEVWVDELHPDYKIQLDSAKTAWRLHNVSMGYKRHRYGCMWGVKEFYYDYTGASHPCCIRMTDDYKYAKPGRNICSKCPL